MVLLSGILSLLLSVVLGILTVFLGFYIFGKITGSIDEEKELLDNNIAVAIMNACFIFGLGFIMKDAIKPMIETLFNIVYHSQSAETGSLLLVKRSLYLPLQFFLTLIISILTLNGSLKIFMWFTNAIDELKEIKQNNIAIAIVIGAVILTMAVIVNTGLEKLLQVIIPSSPISNSSLTPFG